MIYIAVLLACVAGALGAALVASRSALRTARQSAEAYSAEVQRLGGENATLTATLAARDEATEARLADKDRACEERLAELRRTVEETIARLRSEFSALAADKLEEKSGLLSERNAKDVKPLFDALRQNIDEFRKAAESARESNVKLGGELSARIEEVGRKEALGRPILYGTTDKFLSHFGLRSLEDLPKPPEENTEEDDSDPLVP